MKLHSKQIKVWKVQILQQICEIYSCFAVRRLNSILEEYQKKYLPVKEPDVKVKNTVDK